MKFSGMKPSLTAALLLVASPFVAAQQNEDDYRHVYLSGGALQLCSSFNPNNCDDADWIDSDNMRTDRYLNISEKFRIEATSDRVWSAYREETRKKVLDALELIHKRINEDIVSERVFEREFTRRATLQTYNSLSDAEYAKVIDLLEVPMSSSFPEIVNVEESLDKASAKVFRRFADFAEQNVSNEEKPVVYFSTAGYRDPYSRIDFYQSTLSQLGLEARWLPLDEAVIAARAENRCSELNSLQEELFGAYDRNRVYRDDYQRQVEFCESGDAEYEMLANADAVFFAGNNANQIRNAFVKDDNSPSELLRMMVARVQQKKLVVGGTSAGTAVLTAKPMISNGTTASAIKNGSVATNPPPFGCDLDNTCPANTGPDTLTYHPFGGLSLFHFASLDTHFSERGRHGRLVRLAADSTTPLSIGIDENTAMLVNLEKGDFDIIGERGVFFVENAQGAANAVAATFHYLVAGASGMMSPFGIQTAEFADGSNIVQSEPTTNFLTDRGLIDSMRVLCGERKEMTLINKEYRLVAQVDDSSRTATAGGECQIINGKIGMAYQPEEQL
ncbi:MAG: cyanophycinase [Idiomarina sp.]|uniref:cyanophycinase n=1 Tax=Idiomarina sp. TaxID=1874361 RepID=UPI000C67CF3A|nr:cyanophycinase [Idiomarina sp.]MBT42209.1 cyanophycinase [Idiomarina sp.]